MLKINSKMSLSEPSGELGNNQRRLALGLVVPHQYQILSPSQMFFSTISLLIHLY